MSLFSRLFKGEPPEHRIAAELYRHICGQARLPIFFTGLGLPDSVSGRFESVALHGYLLMRRLGQEGEPGKILSQALFDLMFADMDQNLRELGVGDLSVGKKVKMLAKSFYGRIQAYDEGLAEGADAGVLAGALQRNAYAGEPVAPAVLAGFAAYVRHAESLLATQNFAQLSQGQVHFPIPQAHP